jgi:signal transduction histidine kinase/ActR/RegA family two-component response regulator
VNPIARLVPVVAVLLLALTYLAIRGAAPDTEQHERILGALQTLMLNESTLHRDILRARDGLLRNYDPLVRSLDGLREAGSVIQTLNDNPDLGRSVQSMRAALDEQEALVETFKSYNSLLQNSLSYFGYAIHRVNSDDPERVAAVTGVLASEMLRFIGASSPDNAAGATASLDHLAQFGLPSRQDISTLVDHGRLIVSTLPAVNGIVAELLAPLVTDRARAVQDSYLERHGQALALADRFRLVLYAAAVCLAGYLAYLFLRLSKNAQHLRERLRENEALQTQLRRTQRLEAIGTLAGGIAHNFNNILGAILGYAEMALGKLAADSQPRRYVTEVRQAGLRAQAVVDQMLAFSRRTERARRPVLMRGVVGEAVQLLQASLPATVAISVNADTDRATVSGDATQLQQVAMNLCTNAAHAMGGRGTIDVGLDAVDVAREQALSHGTLAAGRYIRLTVSDTGRGIDPATLERIFEPFFTTKPAGTGTGLGLATVHGIVADHGGAMNVRSQPGIGSSFEAYLAAADMDGGDAEDTSAPAPTGRGETVLLVEDDRPLLLLGEEMVAALGYEPIGFGSSTQALSIFEADPDRFDLVLTDEIMPELTGLDLAMAMHRRRSELPIILVTGHSAPLGADRLHAAGIRAVLQKPLLSADMARTLAQHLPPRAGRERNSST